MTSEFKKAVRDVALDGVITEKEEEAIFSMAKREGVEKDEAQIYLSTQLKKRKLKLEKIKYNRNKKQSNLNKFFDNKLVQETGKSAVTYGAKEYLPRVLDFGKKALPKVGKAIVKVISKGK